MKAIDKIVILMSFLYESHPKEAEKIIKTIGSKNFFYVQKIIQHCNKRPIFSEEQVQSALDECYQLAIKKTKLVPSTAFKTTWESALNHQDISLQSDSQSSIIDQNRSVIENILYQYPPHICTIFCAILPPQELSEILMKMPEDKVAQIIHYYSRCNPPSPYLVKKFSEFLRNHCQKSQTSQLHSVTEKWIQLTELFPQKLNSVLSKNTSKWVNWDHIQPFHLQAEDIQLFTQKEQKIILQSLGDYSEIARCLSVLMKDTQETLLNNLDTRLKDILTEELLLITSPNEPTEESNISQKIITTIRQLQLKNQVNPNIKSRRGES